MAKEIQEKSPEKTEKGTRSKGVNSVLWILAMALLTIAAVGNVYFATHFTFIVRVLLLVGLSLGAIVFAAMTNQGQRSIGFIKEARQEIRKVIWPNRQETTQTTFIVVVVCVIVALVLWGIDSIIVSIINFLTNLRF